MISLPDSLLQKVCNKHTKELSISINAKIETLKLCLKYIELSVYGKPQQVNFQNELLLIKGNTKDIVSSINWFLLGNIKKTKKKKHIQRQVISKNKIECFFNLKFRKFENTAKNLQYIKSQLNYFTSQNVKNLISSKPQELLDAANCYNKQFPLNNNKYKLPLLFFLFDYNVFSKKETIGWNAYKLTNELNVRTCLYCNRNYNFTVVNDGKNIIRTELDHFFPKSIYPLLAVSFYNLIPSCHTCNSNLKGKVNFELSKYLHPYLKSFDDENVVFTYEPYNTTGAFNNEKRGIKVKLDVPSSSVLQKQIEGNIAIFKLDEIYDNHQNIVQGLMNLQLKSNKIRLDDIFENVFEKQYFKSPDEIYEILIRNHFKSDEYHLKPLAKFEKDIAKELKLI